MNREQFMKQLSYLLQDISDEDRTDALDYYENYLDEAGFGYETDITNELGSPERIAAIIRTSLLSNPDETGEFTDSGYENSRFKDPGYELAKQHRETDTFTGADRSKHPYTSCGSESGQTYGQAQQSRSSFYPGAERSWPQDQPPVKASFVDRPSYRRSASSSGNRRQYRRINRSHSLALLLLSLSVLVF